MNLDKEIVSELEFIKKTLDCMYETDDRQELQRLRFNAWSGLRRFYEYNCIRLG